MRFSGARSELVAGHSAAGAPGESGGALPAEAGEAGANGTATCSANVVPGGSVTLATCRGIDTLGGQGGYGDLAGGGTGANGQPEPAPNPAGWGLGGLGASNNSTCDAGA